jgi:urea transport system substrate-binding protein
VSCASWSSTAVDDPRRWPRRSTGCCLTGETPDRQVHPALRWLRTECGARRWAVVGDDYIWPRQTAWVTRRYAAEIALETFVPLGTTEFTPTLRAIEARGCDLVLMADGLEFNVLAQIAPP